MPDKVPRTVRHAATRLGHRRAQRYAAPKIRSDCYRKSEMIVRIWKTTFDPAKKVKLIDYANRVSLPVLSSRPGNCGTLFYSDGDEWITQTLWESLENIDALSNDPEYARIVEGIIALGVLCGEQETRVWSYNGGFLQQ